MSRYKAPTTDMMFTLLHGADAKSVPGFDAGMTQEIASHFASFAEGEVAALNATGDAEGCRMENGRVRMPDGFPELYARWAGQGWPGLTAPEEFGGQAQGAVVQGLVSEIFTGANHSLQMVVGLVPGAIRVLQQFGTEAQQARHIPGLASGELLSTMCLTEPGAGSDLARERWSRDFGPVAKL